MSLCSSTSTPLSEPRLPSRSRGTHRSPPGMYVCMFIYVWKFIDWPNLSTAIVEPCELDESFGFRVEGYDGLHDIHTLKSVSNGNISMYVEYVKKHEYEWKLHLCMYLSPVHLLEVVGCQSVNLLVSRNASKLNHGFRISATDQTLDRTNSVAYTIQYIHIHTCIHGNT